MPDRQTTDYKNDTKNARPRHPSLILLFYSMIFL